MYSLNDIFEEMKTIAKKAGDLFASAENINSKQKSSYRDIVTDYDIACEKLIYQSLSSKFADIGFMGEEGNKQSGQQGCFIVDPIDGTSNFAMGIRKSACSIAYEKDGQILLGVVYDPFTKELYTAIKSHGAYLNDKAIRASEADLDNGLVIFGTNPYRPDCADQTFALAKLCYLNAMDVRRFGAASLDFCYMARGSAVLFFEGLLSPWDFAAGGLIAKESGLLVRNFKNEEVDFASNSSIVCASQKNINKFFDLLNQSQLLK